MSDYPGYRDTPLGRFENAEDLKPTLHSTRVAGWWSYAPRPERPMRFVRHSGEVIEPGVFLTDLGTIPRWLRITRLLQPDALPAVALVHDWLVRMNNCGTGRHTFRDSILIQQEALKTWMEGHPRDRNRLLFWLTRKGLTSARSRRGWTYRFATCPPSLDDLLAAQRELGGLFGGGRS